MNEKFFWRKEPLTDAKQKLWDAVKQAHYKSAFRANLSSEAVLRSAAGSGDYFKSIAAALMTLGGLHGPVEEAMIIWSQPIDEIKEFVAVMLAHKRKIAGFGNAFHRGEADPHWAEVENILEKDFSDWFNKLKQVTEFIHAQGKKLFPNPAAYTAVTGLIMGAPLESVGYLFVQARLGAWTELFQNRVERL